MRVTITRTEFEPTTTSEEEIKISIHFEAQIELSNFIRDMRCSPYSYSTQILNVIKNMENLKVDD
jgi:hypothetical protein